MPAPCLDQFRMLLQAQQRIGWSFVGSEGGVRAARRALQRLNVTSSMLTGRPVCVYFRRKFTRVVGNDAQVIALLQSMTNFHVLYL